MGIVVLNARWRRQGSARGQASREVEDRWLLALRGINDGIWDANLVDDEIFLSDRCIEMLGFAPNEIRPSRSEWLGRIHPDDEPGRARAMHDHIAGRTSHYHSEFRMRGKDGAYRWVLSRGQVLFNAEGRAVRAVGSHTDIHSRKLAEEGLRESEERYRTLFEQSPLAILETDYSPLESWFTQLRAAGVQDLAEYFAAHPEAEAAALEKMTVEDCNEAAVRLSGMRSKSALLQTRMLFVGDDGRRVRRENLCALWRGENQTEGEVSAKTIDGTMRRMAYRWWMPVIDGRLSFRAQIVLTDITEVRAAEEALRASEERHRVLFEHSPVAIIEYDYRQIGSWLDRLRIAGVVDLDRYLEENPAELATALRNVVMTGINEETVRLCRAASREQLMGNADAVFTPKTCEARRAAFLAIWEGRNEIEGELTLQAFDGTEVRTYYRWWLPRLGGQLSFAWTQVVLVDVTDIKRTEAALAAERERLRVTLRSMHEGVITTDTAGVVQFINDAVGEMTGWTLGEAMGRRIGEVCLLRHERTRAPVGLPFFSVLNEGRAVDLPSQTAITHRQGSLRLVEGRCAPMHDLAGGVIGAVFVFRDVTERSRLEAELLRSSKLESVGVLAGGIAHDFNNILTIVMGNLTLAMLDANVQAAAGKWLREAERGALRARDLTQQLLTFAKGGEPVRAAVPLAEVVQEAAQFALHGSKVKCEFDLAPDGWPADVDKGQIGQVIQNLVINSVQAMNEGGFLKISLRNDTIVMGARPPLGAGEYLKISIVDGGGGIRPEHLSRIFDPYFTTKQQGSGLGLATVYSIIKKHLGHIEVESEFGHGTTFHIWLPAARTQVISSRGTNTPFASMTGRILFMDDEEPIRQMAEVLLQRLGFETMIVADGAEIVRAFTQAQVEGRPYDVVVMDLTVPGGMGGREAMDILLKLDPQVKAIVSSGYSSDPIMANYRAHGFRGRVAKPYRISDLAKALRRVIENTEAAD